MGNIFVTLTYEGTTTAEPISKGLLLSTGIIALLFYLTMYVLRSLGIYTLAKRNGVEHPFMAWIPCVWIFTACKLIREQLFFGKRYEKFALAFAIIFSAAQVLSLVYYFLIYFPLAGYFFSGGTIYLGEGITAVNPKAMEFWTGELFVGADFVSPYGTAVYKVANVISVIGTISSLFDLVVLVITINLYIALFRKFWPQHYILASVLSFFGLFAPFIFAIRKKPAINYAEYMRSRNQYYYGNGYNGQNYQNNYNNTYNNGYAQQSSSSNEDPFSEFEDEPFDDVLGRKEDGDKK